MQSCLHLYSWRYGKNQRYEAKSNQINKRLKFDFVIPS